MKTIDRYLGIALMGLALGSLAACTDHEEWDVDSSHGRLFGATEDGISVTAAETSATVEFSAQQPKESNTGNIYYIIEVSKDSLYDDVEMGGENAIVYGEDKSITSSPAEITGLDGDTEYYLRLKVMSDTKKESRWSYYNDGEPFETLAEQLFIESEIVRGDTYIDLKWTPGAEVTHITVTASDGTPAMDDIDLEQYPDAVANGEYKVEPLTQMTTYVFTIYNGDVKRGEVTLTTAASMPDAEFKYTLPSTATVLSQDIIDDVEQQALASGVTPESYSVTIGIPAGLTLDVYGIDEETGDKTDLKIPNGMSITFFGLAGGEVPTLQMGKCIDVSGSHAYVRFNNLNVVENGSSYFINQSKSCAVGEISFESVTINELKNAFVRFKDSDEKSLGKLLINDCVMTNQNGGPVVYFKESNTTLSEVTITNSTFDGCLHNFIQISGSKGDAKISIESCTFYNVIGSGRYLIDAQKNNSEILISRSIFAKTASTSSKGVRNGGTTNIAQVYFTSDFELSSNAIEPTVQLTESSTDVFADPENHNFTLQMKDLEIGDPRWRQ